MPLLEVLSVFVIETPDEFINFYILAANLLLGFEPSLLTDCLRFELSDSFPELESVSLNDFDWAN